MNLLEKIVKMQKVEKEERHRGPVSWIEVSDSLSRRFLFQSSGSLTVNVVDDLRPTFQKISEFFVNNFFPSGYPHSVNEGYIRYTQFRALQHLSSAALSVLSTQSLLLAAGLRPTPAQSTAISWILKDGMQHIGRIICSNFGARMDSEPKCWRILADVLYDLGTGLEVLSPLCPHLFLEVAGLGNFAKGIAVVAARSTRLPIYSSFAKEGNLSDIFAKGEAISTLFNIVGLGMGIQLASTVCSSLQGKLVVGPVLAMVHICSVVEEMRAVPVNTLNPQRTAMIIADFVKEGKVSSPGDLRYRESLLFPGRLIEDAGNVRIGGRIRDVLRPSEMREARGMMGEERFVMVQGEGCMKMVMEENGSGADALRGWLVAAYAYRHATLPEAYERMRNVFPCFLSQLQAKGWYTDRFIDGPGCRFFRPKMDYK